MIDLNTDSVAATERFHQIWYDARVWEDLTWMGISIQKNPFDLFQYQEVLFTERPEVLIECGAYKGGATLFFAQMLDLIGQGEVISIDTVPRWRLEAREHPRVTTITGRSVDRKVFARVRELVRNRSSMVVLDSDHTQPYVEEELALYSGLLRPGNLIVVEDTDVNGHPVHPTHGPGPFEAVESFLRSRPDFFRDEARGRKLLFTSAPGGWLRKGKTSVPESPA